MSNEEEKVFGINKNSVIAVVSALIFLLAVAMMVYYIYDGVTNTWTGSNVIGAIMGSVIALIFVSVAANYGFIKGKEVAATGKNYLRKEWDDLKGRNQLDKNFAENLKKAKEAAIKEAQNKVIAEDPRKKEYERQKILRDAEKEAKEAEKIKREKNTVDQMLASLSEKEKNAVEKNPLLKEAFLNLNKQK